MHIKKSYFYHNTHFILYQVGEQKHIKTFSDEQWGL